MTNKKIEKADLRLEFWRKILNSLWSLVFFLGIAIFFIVGPRLEVMFNPVITTFEVLDVQYQGDDRYLATGAMFKARGNCTPVSVSATAGGLPNEVNSKIVDIIFRDRDEQGGGNILRARPEGSQYWGPWEIIFPERPIGPILHIYVIHDCHILWNTTQVLYRGATADLFPEMDEQHVYE